MRFENNTRSNKKAMFAIRNKNVFSLEFLLGWSLDSTFQR
jgi:hypothetical protein